ncbi:MAG: ATP-binding protein [Propionibacteriaceae bacterium]|nr:ATP-binding protein [Propionibacteriaceae bacterium]
MLRSKKALSHVIATARAFGGFTVVLTKRHKIVYASPLARSLVPHDRGVLVHPDLTQVADEAWVTREHITRSCHATSLGSYQEIVIQAEVVETYWILLSVTDRTDEVRAVQIRRDFVSNIGHELRTPVTSVGLIAQALHSCASDPGAVEHFALRLDKVARRLEKLADGMLALAHVQDTAPAQPVTQISVAEWIGKAVSQAIETARIQGVKLKTKKIVDHVVEGDEDALVTALENLLSNAIHYSPKGSRVVVSSQIDEADGTVSVHVIDQGIGIAPDDQDRIFERFYRADQARSRRSGGTGLGLAIVKHTALAHGGGVSVDSHQGSGSTFTITLPLAGTGRFIAANEEGER